MSAKLLTTTPQQGALTFRYGKFTYTYDGWWWVSGVSVMRRTVDDTRGWRQCHIAEVITFVLTTTN